MEVICANCSKKFDKRLCDIKKTANDFCSKSCAATFNNTKFPKRHCEPKYCLKCGIKCRKKFCTHKCQMSYQRNCYIKKWQAGKVSGMVGKRKEVSIIIYQYMLDKASNKCTICNWNKIHPITHKIPLQLHHKDGNFQHTTEKNLEVLCPNCHSLTSTYGALNTNPGRRISGCM